jgi:hypothetical protein
MANDDGVAAAKARLIQVAGQIDPLEPLRKHPLLTVAVAGAGGAAMGASAEHLAGAAVLARSVTAMLRVAIDAIERKSHPPERTEPCPTPNTPPRA